MFKLKAKLVKELPVVRPGLIFRDNRSISKGGPVYTLVKEVEHMENPVIRAYFCEKNLRWTSDFLELNLKEGGLLTLIGYKDL